MKSEKLRDGLIHRAGALLVLCLSLFFLSCENDGYDTGDGSLSYMRADFVEAYTNDDALITYVITDDDEQLTLASPYSVTWVTEPNAVYRALLYYDMSTTPIEPITISSVSVPTVVMAADVEDNTTDPLYWDSAWQSGNGRYINLGLSVMIGAEDGTIGSQTVGMRCDSIAYDDAEACEIYLTLLHNQCDVPEYYSSRAYLSIPISYLPCTVSEGDKVSVTVNTYDGIVTKTFEL